MIIFYLQNIPTIRQFNKPDVFYRGLQPWRAETANWRQNIPAPMNRNIRRDESRRYGGGQQKKAAETSISALASVALNYKY